MPANKCFNYNDPQYFDYKVTSIKQLDQYFVNHFKSNFNKKLYCKAREPQPKNDLVDFEEYIDSCIYHYLSKNKISPDKLDYNMMKIIFTDYSFYELDDELISYEYLMEIFDSNKFKNLTDIQC